MENTHGGILDFKMYELNDQDYYKNNIIDFMKYKNSIEEPNSRTLYIYKGIAYNLNEYGNLKFGAAHAYLGTNLEFLIKMGHFYSLIKNGKLDAENEVQAIRNGYNSIIK